MQSDASIHTANAAVRKWLKGFEFHRAFLVPSSQLVYHVDPDA